MTKSLGTVRERERESSVSTEELFNSLTHTQVKLNEKQAIRNSLINILKNGNTVI